MPTKTMPFSRSALTSAGCLFSQTIVRVHARHVCCVANNRSSNAGAVRWSLSCLIESMQYFSPATSFACVRLASTSAPNAVRHVKHELLSNVFRFRRLYFGLHSPLRKMLPVASKFSRVSGKPFSFSSSLRGRQANEHNVFKKRKDKKKVVTQKPSKFQSYITYRITSLNDNTL